MWPQQLTSVGRGGEALTEVVVAGGSVAVEDGVHVFLFAVLSYCLCVRLYGLLVLLLFEVLISIVLVGQSSAWKRERERER